MSGPTHRTIANRPIARLSRPVEPVRWPRTIDADLGGSSTIRGGTVALEFCQHTSVSGRRPLRNWMGKSVDTMTAGPARTRPRPGPCAGGRRGGDGLSIQ